MTDAAVSTPSTERSAAGEHRHAHHPSNAYYVRIAVALGVITGLEIAISYTSLPSAIMLVGLLLLMSIKFVVVASNFMHLKFDDKLLTRVFYGGLLLAVGVYVAVLSTFGIFGWNN